MSHNRPQGYSQEKPPTQPFEHSCFFSLKIFDILFCATQLHCHHIWCDLNFWYISNKISLFLLKEPVPEVRTYPASITIVIQEIRMCELSRQIWTSQMQIPNFYEIFETLQAVFAFNLINPTYTVLYMNWNNRFKEWLNSLDLWDKFYVLFLSDLFTSS